MAKFTIITICLNSEAEIGNTIASVLEQSCTDYEYLIKDGVSGDKTVCIAESFAPAFAKMGIPFRIISRPDSGVYDAMNQAIREAQGDWIVPMNAGDRFANRAVLEHAVKSGCLENADIVYGDRILMDGELYRYQAAGALENIRFSLPFGHQSSFTNRSLFRDRMYSTQYRICSDHAFYLQMYLEGKKFVYLPEAVAIFEINGISANWKAALTETIQIWEEMPVRDEAAIQQLKRVLEEKTKKTEHAEFMHRILWRFVPRELRRKRRKLRKLSSGWKTEEEFFGKEKE